MTPEQKMKATLKEVADAVLSMEKSMTWLESQMDISGQALGRIIYGGNKTGCSLLNLFEVLHFLGWELKLVKQPLSPDSAGVLPVETTTTQPSK